MQASHEPWPANVMRMVVDGSREGSVGFSARPQKSAPPAKPRPAARLPRFFMKSRKSFAAIPTINLRTLNVAAMMGLAYSDSATTRPRVATARYDDFFAHLGCGMLPPAIAPIERFRLGRTRSAK